MRLTLHCNIWMIQEVFAHPQLFCCVATILGFGMSLGLVGEARRDRNPVLLYWGATLFNQQEFALLAQSFVSATQPTYCSMGRGRSRAPASDERTARKLGGSRQVDLRASKRKRQRRLACVRRGHPLRFRGWMHVINTTLVRSNSADYA